MLPWQTGQLDYVNQREAALDVQFIPNRKHAPSLADFLFLSPANSFFQVLFRPTNVILDSLRHAFTFFRG